MNREQWLQERMKGLGASDCAAALGVSPWKSPFALWAEKTGIPDDIADNEAVEFGIRLERPIAEAYAERRGVRVELWPQFEIVSHPRHPWLRCTPDALQWAPSEVWNDESLVQIKTSSAFKASEWADGIPLHYEVQLQIEMAVTGHQSNTLVVLIGGQRLRYFDRERNDKFIAAVIPRLAEFWERVETRTPPDVDGSIATAKVLAKLHPDDSGETIVLPEDAMQWTRQISRASEAIEEAEERKQLAMNRIKAAMGDATFGMLPDGSRWSWKTQQRKGYTVEPSSCRVLRKVK